MTCALILRAEHYTYAGGTENKYITTQLRSAHNGDHEVLTVFESRRHVNYTREAKYMLEFNRKPASVVCRPHGR
jgi:hypothetical protein